MTDKKVTGARRATSAMRRQTWRARPHNAGTASWGLFPQPVVYNLIRISCRRVGLALEPGRGMVLQPARRLMSAMMVSPR